MSVDGATHPRVLVAVAGWSYPDWKGVVYPRRVDDALCAVAEYVPAIEINSSFYRTPEQSLVAAWVERTAEFATRFTVKLPRTVTHQRRLDRLTAADFMAGFEPLRASGRLRAVLAQFSHALHADADGIEWLRRIAETFGGFAPLVVELRDAGWSRSTSAVEEVAAMGFSIAHLDYPGAFDGGGTAAFGATGLAYYRLHGRNRKNWFDKDAGRDSTYDWQYSARERGEVQARIEGLLEQAADVIVVANNHFEGKAAKLALELMSWAEGGRQVAVPPTLLARYPDLAPIALPPTGGSPMQGSLF